MKDFHGGMGVGVTLRSSGPFHELGRHKKALILLSSLTLVIFLYSESLQYNFYPHHEPAVDQDYDPNFLVRTPGCKLRTMDPYDASGSKFFRKSSSIPRCRSRRPLVTLVNGTRLLINQPDNKVKGFTCCWREIRRKTQSPDNYDEDADYGVEISPNCTTIPIGPDGALPTPGTQYLKVECVGPLGKKMWKDFFPLTPSPKILTPSTARKTVFWEQERRRNVTLPPNVMVIGIDSISRLHMIRSMPRTKDLLQSKGFVEMRGYTKVGDNTFPNLMAAFGGMTGDETVTKCWPTRKTTIDSCPLIWKNFSDLNYVTAFVEDSPGLASFNYDKTGFVIQPTDYYLRPLMVAEHQAAKHRDRFGGSNDCLGGGLTPTRVLFRYIRHLVQEVDGLAPFFLLSWFNSVAHDDFHGLKGYDQEFRTFLDNLITSVGDNTLLLFISDHGYRYGSFRETFLGFYEESLPFFFIRIPHSLSTPYPEWTHSLRTNSARLTSPHDLYATFVQLLSVVAPKSGVTPPTPSSLHAPSLFQVAPLTRNCEDSFVPQKYCMCGVTQTLTTSSDLASDLGNFIVNSVNTELVRANLSESICIPLTYSGFLYGREVGDGEAWNGHGKLEPYQDILLAVETQPWKGRFEARIRIFTGTGSRKGRKEILGSVGRINSYAGQSDCIRDKNYFKSYCACRTLWEEEERRRKAKKEEKWRMKKNQTKESESKNQTKSVVRGRES